MANKNLFLQSPDAGDIEEIFAKGADALTSAAPAKPSAAPAPQQAQQAPQDSTPRRPAPTAEDIARRATELGIDPALPLAIWGVESGSNFKSRDSYKGAVGGMQVMPDTYKAMMGSYSGQRDPWNNMEAGLRYIAYGQKTLGTKDPKLLAAGYHAGYDRKDLKAGQIPQGIGDGLMKTSDYAAKVAGKVGLGGAATAGDTPNLQQQLDQEEPGRYQVLTEDEATAYQRKTLQSSLDGEEAGRYQVLTPEEMRVYEAGNAPAVQPPVQKQGGIGSTLLDIGKMGLGGVYKGVGQVLGGVGEAVAMLGDYTTTPLINAALGTNYRTGNLLEKPADWYKKGGEGLQASISKESLEAVRDSSPGGDLFKPSTWTFGKAPSLRGYAMLGADVLGSMAPVVAASVASGGSAVVGGVVGGAQGGGAAAGTARETIDKMVKDGTIADQSAYYRELIAAGKSQQEAVQLTQDAAAQWALLLTAPVSAAGGALTSKIVDPATKIVVGGSLPARIAGRGAIGGLEEGVQEATETVQTQSGINRGAGTNLSVTEGTFGDFVLGALGGGVTGGGAGALSSRDTSGKAQQAQQPAQARQEPTIDVTYTDPQGNTVTEVVPGAPAQPEAAAQTEAAAQPAPQPSGPIGRALEKAAPAAPVQEAAPAPETAAEPELPRVRITAENGQTMTGFAEHIGADGSGRVLGDDGQVYQFTADDGVTITVEGQAKAPRDEPEAQPAATESEADSAQQQPEAAAQDPEAEAEQAQEAPNSEAQASTIDSAKQQPAQDQQAPAATETEADRPLTEWSEQELRDRLRYVTQQAKNNGGWDKRLTTIKREVSAEIDRRNKEAKNDQQPAANAVPDAPVAPASDQAAAPVPGNQPARSAPNEVADVRADAGQAASRATEPPVGEVVSGADAAAQPDAALTPTNSPGRTASWVIREKETGNVVMETFDKKKVDALNTEKYEAVPVQQHLGELNKAMKAENNPHAGKWFGSREKADAYIAKKKAWDTHEVVQTGKVLFEIKPKAQAAQTPQNVAPTVAAENAAAAVLQQGGTEADANRAATDALIERMAEDPSVSIAQEAPKAVKAAQEKVQTKKPGRSVVRTYKTKSGKIGATVTENVSPDGRVTYSYTGEWGAGSGLDADTMAKKEAGWKSGKRGFTVEDAAPAAQATPAAAPVKTKQPAMPRQDFDSKAGVGKVSSVKQSPSASTDTSSTVAPEAVKIDRAALEDRAAELGISFIDRHTDKSLQAEVNRAEKAAAKDAPAPEPKTDPFANNKLFTADKVAAARARMKSKLGRLNSGIDPELLMDGMTVAGAYIEAGVRKFSDFAKAMVDDMGDGVKPYLLSFWEGARNYPGLDVDGMTDVEESKRLHADLLTHEVKAAAAEAIGEPVAKPAKRTKKTGAAGDKTLTQDWGVEHIDGYGDADRETGNTTKDAFLKEARDYLRATEKILAEQGYAPQPDRNGRPRKGVSVNESGAAGSGEVSLALYSPEVGAGVYVHIGDTSLRGVVPTTASGIAIMFRATKEGDPYGSIGPNRWAPVDLSAADLAIMVDQEARRMAKPSQPATIAPKEAVQNDRQATAGAADQGTPNQSAAEVRADEGSGDAGPVPANPAGADAGSDQRGAPGRDQQRSERGQPAVPSEPAGADAGDQQRTKGGRGSGNRAGDGADRGAASRVGNDYRINPEELKRTGSWKATAEQNVRIVELVKQLEKEGRRPSADEAALLTKFTGWGASEIANGIFPDRWGRYKPGWEELGQRLKAVLTEEEYAQASRTTQYAHYTSPQVIGSIYDGLRRLGFGGGKVLEPGMGIGLFKGLMPANVAAASQYTGVEYDSITGAIAKLLYPESNIIVGDFTKTGMPRDFFDAAIGNPPFASTVISNDPEYKKQGFMLHDYFFAKTIDRVKPGGLLVFVTSKGTMDKGTDRARKYLGDRANLLGAIRLPQTAFKDNAGTEVVTDVIFLQKRGDGIPDNGVKWMGTAEVQTPQGATQINEYFAAHPEMVLGTNALTGSMYRVNEYTVIPEPGVDMDEAFAKAIQNLPEAVYKPGAKNPAAAAAVAVEREFNPSHKKEGGLYINDKGTLMQVDSGSGVELTHRRGSNGKQIALKPADKAFLKSWVGLRDALKAAQLDQLTDGNWEKSLKALGKAYDAFVKQHGNLLAYSAIERTAEDGTVTVTKRFKNDPLLRLDVDGALAYSLEHIKESGEIVKAPVLTGRVLEKKRPPEIKTTQDALFVSLNDVGSLDLDHVAKLAGMGRDEVIEALGNEIYEAPGAGWQTADAYLSGNVVRKLKEAQAAARSDKSYQRNIDALLAVQPKPLGPTEITVKLGQNWVPASDIVAFARESLGETIEVSYNARLGAWTADQKGSNYTEFNTPKMDAGKILDSVLNNRQIKITWRDDEGKTHVDAEATEKANDVAKKMREQFARWIWTDAKRADRLVNYYNEHFNNIAPRQFDGSHLTLPGVSLRFNLYPHQKRAIWRMIQEGDAYLAHAVGAGKTFTMIAAGMEERRLGLSNKPMYVVPNHMLAQFAREFLELYPAANIMVADEQNFHTHNRRRFVAQAALNNPDAIIITHSAFGRIGMSDEFAGQFISDQIDEWKMALEETDKSDRITRKQIERRIEQLERRLEARQGKDKKDAVLAFEELGVDRLFVDEAHEFRKLDFATNQGNIKGIDPAGSQRAMDLFMKVTYLRGKKPGRALVAASGTPITNTMGELFTVQRLFQPDQLEEDGLDTFDAWANQYGDVVAGFEQNAAGGYEVVSRFAKFQNVPELMRRVRSFMDILTSANLGELVQRPAVEGGGRQVVVTPEPDGYRAYQKTLESRINAIRNRKGQAKKGEDIILNVIADGRFSAIDMRFVDPSLPSDPKSKLNQAIDGLIEAYNATADNEYMTNGKPDPIKGASLILFTDIGLGEQSAESRGFNMKGWIEKRLTEAGIPREHIAFMRDHKEHAKKERLFADMREGKKRILIGGKDMETGVNVQKRLAYLAHLDAPWFPASVEQREGRIVRQGNQNKNVRMKAFATKGSYDSTMWGMNGRKARFIEQAMNGDYSVRTMEDVSEASAFEMAAALASGDERYMKLAGLKSDIDRLERLRHAHYDDQNKLRRDKHWAETSIERDQKFVADLDAAIAKRTPIRAGEFAGKVGKVSYTNRDEFSSAIFNRTKELAADNFDGEQQIGEIGGFPITYFGVNGKGSGSYGASVEVMIPGDPSPLLSVPLDPDTAVAGIATRAANQVNSLDRMKAEAASRIETNKRRSEQIGQRLGAPFAEEADLMEKVAALNSLEAELTAEKAQEGAEAVTAEAAAATVEAEGEAEAAPKFSIAAGVDRAQVVPVASIESFDVAPEALYETANEWFRENLTGVKVRNESLGADINFSRAGRSKVTSVGRRDPRRMSVVKALPELAKNGVLVEEQGDRKGREGLEGYATLVAPVSVDGVTYAVSMKVRRATGRDIFYTVEAFNLENASDGGVGPLTLTGDAHSTAALQIDGDATAVNEPGAAAAPSTAETGVTVGALLDAINKVGRAFSIETPSTTDANVMGERENGNAINGQSLRVSLTGGTLGGVIQALMDRGSVVLHDTAASLPVDKAPVGTQAVTMPDGKIHLVADMLTASTAQSVLLHEAFHGGAQKLIGTPAWDGLMKRLSSIHRQAEQSSGRAREFYDAARARVTAAKRTGTMPEAMTAEEFGAYTIEQYEQAPPAFRKWVDDVIGAIKAWLLRRFGLQAGAVTPAQLRALAVAALRAGMAEQDAPRYSISDEQKAKVLDEADKALSEPNPDDRIGRVVNDVSLGARLLVHPRTIAAIHPEFTPVYNTAISQIETRDKNIAELGRGVESYNALTTEQKANVNKVLELGRLMSKTFTTDELAGGVANVGYKQTVRVGDDGKPRPVRESVKALLTEAGEVVQLTDAETKAYLDLRGMFDVALDKFRDQTLEEFGFPDLTGKHDAAKAIDKLVQESKSEAEAERLRNIADFIREIEQAKRTGYVPFARYGDYVVTVKEKVADLEFEPDGDDAYIVRGVPKELEDEMIALNALPEGDAWIVPKANRAAVARLGEKTVYSAKVETGLSDFIERQKGAKKVDDLPSVKAAIEHARKEWIGDNPKRRLVAFRVSDKAPDEAVSLTDVDALAEIANIDNVTWDAVRDKLATAIQGRSFRKHFFHSDNVPGYTGDFERAIADYVLGMGGYLARRKHQKRWDNSVNAIKEKGKLHQYAAKYRQYVNDPQEEFAAIRQVGFFSYIAGVMATAFANLTQVPLLTLPTLAQVAPAPLVLKETARAYQDALGMLSRKKGMDLFDPSKAPEDVRKDLMEAWDEGAFVPLETFDMMMMARQRNVGRRKLVKGFNDATKMVSIAFTFAERLNRLVTYIAAARLSEKPAVQKNANARLSKDSLARSTILGSNWSAKNFAEWAIDESQYRMGKANRPTSMRGIGSPIMQFKGFMLQTFEAWYRMAALHGKEGKYAAAASLVALYAMAGVWGMPGADDLRKLIEAAYKAITSKDLDLKTELRAWVARTSGSNTLAQITTKGVTYPLGVDLTRVGMGTVAPDSALHAAGIPFDLLVGRPTRAFGKASAGDTAGAVAELTPNFMKHWIVAGGWKLDGVRDKYGQRIMAPEFLTTGDLLVKGMGFTPSIITDVRDYEYAQRRQETAVDQLKRRYAAQIARTLVAMERAEEEGDAKKLEKLNAELDQAYADLDAHNAGASPQAQIKIDMRTVRQRMARERGGVMQSWGRERKSSREGAEELRDLFGLSGDGDESD